ncbi:hypothetical protein [Enterobacter wuhouensis]|uniref:hypothetical protein n=1 Tax=Enterobacter wuhouensis TaxID=2529381 RepID=UPI0035257B15
MRSRGKYLLIAVAALSSLSTHVALADDECQLSFTTSGISFGLLKQNDVVEAKKGWNQMPSREINVNVNCQDSQPVALFIQGRAGEKGRFYFGESSGLAVRVSNMVVDGKSYAFSKTADRTHFTPSGESQESLLLRNNDGIIAVDNQAPVSGSHMSFTMKLTPVLNDRQFSYSTDITTLESDLMWEVLTQQ